MSLAIASTPTPRAFAKNVTVKLNEQDRERIQALASYKKRTPHYLMREAIEAYLQKEEAQQATLKLIDQGNAHFEATGLHVTTQDMRAWLTAVRSDHGAARPISHL
jgi:predicted transcriptional regulator